MNRDTANRILRKLKNRNNLIRAKETAMAFMSAFRVLMNRQDLLPDEFRRQNDDLAMACIIELSDIVGEDLKAFSDDRIREQISDEGEVNLTMDCGYLCGYLCGYFARNPISK